MIRLIPVIDLQHGVVVRGIGGRRSEYQPLVSCLTASFQPNEVARALIQAYHPRVLYVADLDVIAGRQPSWPMLARGFDPCVDLWIDAGVRTIRDVQEVDRAHSGGLVLGLETVTGPEVVDAVIAEFGSERIVFSLDLKGGQMLGESRNWNVRNERDWEAVIVRAVRAGVKRLILLDLERVGEGRGVGTEGMCRSIVSQYPELEIICGGGVRDIGDLHRLQECGASAALVASALHDGRIKPGDWPPTASAPPR